MCRSRAFDVFTPTLFVASLVAFVAGSVYMVLAQELRLRATESPRSSRRALNFFALWWACLGVNILIAACFYLAASLGYTDFPTYLVYANLQRLLLSISLVGLMYYLLYLLSGRDWLAFIGPVYAAYFLLAIYSLYAARPDGVYVGQWRADVQPTQEAPAILALMGFVMIVLPPVIAAFAYFVRLFFKKDLDRLRKYRVALVSWSIILWWVMAVVAGQREAFGLEYFQLINRFAGLAAALVILAAYHPPAFLRPWLQKGAPTNGTALADASGPAARAP